MLTIKKAVLVSFIASSAFLSGCATNYPIGAAFTDLNLPLQATNEDGNASKQGKSSCVSYASMVATGDCSIEAAKRASGIREVHHMDWKVNSMLGIISHYELTVYGN